MKTTSCNRRCIVLVRPVVCDVREIMFEHPGIEVVVLFEIAEDQLFRPLERVIDRLRIASELMRDRRVAAALEACDQHAEMIRRQELPQDGVALRDAFLDHHLFARRGDILVDEHVHPAAALVVFVHRHVERQRLRKYLLLVTVRRFHGRNALAADAAHGERDKRRSIPRPIIPHCLVEADTPFLQHVVLLHAVHIEFSADRDDERFERLHELRCKLFIMRALIF